VAEDGFEYETETDGETLHMTPYRSGVNAYLRWRYGDRSGDRGGVTADGRFVFDVRAYVQDGGDAETAPLDAEVHESVLEELETLRDEGVAEELGDEAASAFAEDKRIFERAREILAEEDGPVVDDFEPYELAVEVGDRTLEVELRAVEHEGLAEVRVTADGLEGYAPTYELGEGWLTLPAMGSYGFTNRIEVPDDVAEPLLDDLTTLQEQLNARRKAYDDAVERARDEVLDG
jgi:hypothetical protein